MKNSLRNIKSNTMKNSWLVGLITPRTKGTEKKPLVIGTKFNHLTVIRFHHFQERENKRGYFYYLCKCDCGKEKIIIKESILRGHSKSCGCFRIIKSGLSHRHQKGHASLSRIYDSYICRAKSKKIRFDISLEDFKSITSDNCYYCGTKPNQYFANHKNHYYGVYKYNGLDRINPTIGYTKNNSVACCKYCNFAKNDLTTRKFYKHIKKIYEYIKKR